MEEQPFDLRTCIEESLDLLAPKAADKGLELAYLIEPLTPIGILGDVTRLRQILVNLLSNAVKFTHVGEVLVEVSARKLGVRDSGRGAREAVSPRPSTLEDRPSYEIQFAVKDTGIGIPTDRIDRLFQSFSQVDSSTNRHYGGTGLGLAISKRLSEMMGGSMWVETQVGKGSTFFFSVVAPPVFCELQNDLRASQPQLTGKRLLIVDDNATNRQILTLQAQSWGMLTHSALSSFEALSLLCTREPFDVVILNMQMPQMDGLTLAAKIRKQPERQRLLLVMLTSIGQSVSEIDSQAVNFAAFLHKPIKQSQLYNVLNSIFSGQPIKARQIHSASPQLNSQLAQQLPLRILLAEDHLVNQKMALLLLQRMGYRADVASNGIEVLEALHLRPYDLVLMDVQMPEMDGLTATRNICEQWSPAQRPRIIAMTANAMQGDRQACLDAGMDDYISKPIRVQELVQALSQCQPKRAGAQGRRENCSAPVDVKMLHSSMRDMAGENAAEIMVELIDCYLEEAPLLVQAIGKAVAQEDAATLRQAAHSLKSSSLSFGAVNLSNLCQQLEAIGCTGTIAEAVEKVPQLQSEYERVQAALQVECARGSS